MFSDTPQSEVFLQAVGASVQHAVDIALMIEEKYAQITFEIDTFTMPIVDEIVEKGTGEVVREEMRLNSGILIKVIKNRD